MTFSFLGVRVFATLCFLVLLHSLYCLCSPVEAFASQKQKSAGGRRARKASLRKQDYERRRDLWLERYGSLEALEATFGKAPSIYGDLSPEQTRRLYHTLLPRSLLALSQMGLMNPEELAPLAYEARIAAKQYARSRCVLPGRIVTIAFDTYRTLRDNRSSSMTWDEIWSKYEAQIVQEECETRLHPMDNDNVKESDDLTMQIYLRILERSCATNQAFDNLFLEEAADDATSEQQLLEEISSKLERDVRAILLNPKESDKALRKAAKIEKKAEKAELKEEKKRREAERKEEKKREKAEKRKRRRGEEEQGRIVSDAATKTGAPSVSQRYELLRILAGTRRRFRRILRNE